MKINTDGVLLGALAGSGGTTQSGATANMLDIGTGTGVIAIMLAQRFPEAQIDGVEIDKLAATTAAVNFQASPFASRLRAIPLDIEHYFMVYPDKRFDLIVSNPPFFIDDLKSTEKNKEVARHTNLQFFENLCISAAQFLSKNGQFWLVLPLKNCRNCKKHGKIEKFTPSGNCADQIVFRFCTAPPDPSVWSSKSRTDGERDCYLSI